MSSCSIIAKHSAIINAMHDMVWTGDTRHHVELRDKL